MRLIRKRVTCVNRGDDTKNQKAIEKVMQNYLKKMEAKGWRLFANPGDEEDAGYISEGNAFFRYERYFTICKD